MDQNKISRIIKETLKGFEHKSSEIFFEENDVVRIVVVSNIFMGVRLLKRLDTLTEMFKNVSAEELLDYHLIFNPLTINEKELGISEIEAQSNSYIENIDGKIAGSGHPM